MVERVTWLYIRLKSRCNETKKLVNWLAMSFGLIMYSPLLLRIILGDSDSLVFMETVYLIPFQVLLTLLKFFPKKLL